MGDSFDRDVETAVGPYDSLIKPILTYASDYLECTKKDIPIEIMQMKVYKQIPGVHRQTTNIVVFLELGRQTLNMKCINLA